MARLAGVRIWDGQEQPACRGQVRQAMGRLLLSDGDRTSGTVSCGQKVKSDQGEASSGGSTNASVIV